MITIGHILFAVGLFTLTVGEIMFLAVAFRQGAGWFLACALVPFVCWIFFFLFVRNTFKPVAIQFAGLLVLLLGCYLARGISFL
jgi:hypothetical protein